jgi:hypothetical protein
MLCKFCKDFDYDQLTSEEGYRRHENWQQLCDSAEAGCDICALGKEVAREKSPWEWRWNESQRTRQIICKLINSDTMAWHHGEIQRSNLRICTSDGESKITTENN